jgi:hypothetical protein
LDLALRILLDRGDSMLIGSSTSIKNQVLSIYFGRLLIPVWQLNIVSIDANGRTTSNSDYFRSCRVKVIDFEIFLRENRNNFIGSAQPRFGSEQAEGLEEKNVR